MAKVKFNRFIDSVHGKHGNVVFKVIRGESYATKRAHSKKPPTENQLEWRRFFRRASEFAKTVKTDSELLAFYAPLAKKAERRIREIIMSDAFESPVIKSFDLSRFTGKAGSQLTLVATDNYGVVSVEVSLSGRDRFWEKGQAVQKRGVWRYEVRATPPAGPIEVRIVASDRALNRTEACFTWLPPKSVG
jgi:hypothetical protein